jgi:hypothetical protein
MSEMIGNLAAAVARDEHACALRVSGRATTSTKTAITGAAIGR